MPIDPDELMPRKKPTSVMARTITTIKAALRRRLGESGMSYFSSPGLALGPALLMRTAHFL